MRKYLTFDVGGSAIKYALIQEDLTIIKKENVPTPTDTWQHFEDTIGEIYDQYANEISGIAMSMPGAIDPDKGYSYTGGALTYIENIPTVEILQKRCPTNITIGNDAKCAALAEVGFGSLKDVDDAVIIILGTGIGGCLIHNKKVLMGKNFCAGEFSAIQTNINCENGMNNDFWCFRNGIAGLLKRVQDQLQTNQHMTGKEIFEMANNGNEKVLKAIDLFTRDIAVQIFNLQTIFDPERFAIGGGISAQPLLIEMIQKNLELFMKDLSGFPTHAPQVVPCYYRNDANLIGALYQHLQTF